MKKIGIFGTSGFAREVADIASELGYQPVFIARAVAEAGEWNFSDEVILEKDIGRLLGAAFAIGIGENAVREKVARRYDSTLDFVNLIHPSATFGRGQREEVESRRGVIVCAGVRFTNNITTGNFIIANLNATIGHDVIMEDFVNLAPGVHISGNVTIQAQCWIGTGAVINQGTNQRKLSIGAETVVGSGAVVIRDCEPGGVYVGAPAKRIK